MLVRILAALALAGLILGCNGKADGPGDDGAVDADGSEPGDYGDYGDEEGDAGDDAGGDDAVGGDDAGGDDGGGGDDGSNPDAGADADAGECLHSSIHTSPGMFFEVQDGASRHIVTPAGAGLGFRCIRAEFDVEALDNIDEIANMGLGCPIFLHIAAVSVPDAQRYRALAAGWFRFRQQGCTLRWGGQLEVAVNANSTGFRGHVNPGRTYHVVLEVDRLETARLAFFNGGNQVGPTLELPVTGITRDRTNNFRLAFGIDGIGDGAYFPYFGARYFNLEVFADQRP